MKRAIVIFLIVLLLILLAGIMNAWATPVVVEFQPTDGSASVPASTTVRITFSRPMQAEAVIQGLHFEPPREGEFTWEGDTLNFTPAQPWSSLTTVTVSLDAGVKAAGFPALPLRRASSWTFTTRQPRLVYLSPADGPADLYLYDLESEETIRLTDNTGPVLDFSVAASGALIYYTAGLGASGSSIYRLELPGAEATEVLACPQAICRYPQASPQDDFLAYEETPLARGGTGARSQVWLQPLPSDASTPAKSILAGETAHQLLQPLWSPTGKLTFYDYTAAAFVTLDPRTQERIEFPSHSGIPGVWSPDGQYFVFPEIFTLDIQSSGVLTDLNTIPSSHLLRFNAQDKSQLDLTVMDYLEDSLPAYSPRGDVLAFARKYLDLVRWTPGRQLWFMNPDGSEARPLTNEPYFNHYGFAWSPDGDLLAYVRFNENLLLEPPEIWVMQSDGSRRTKKVTGGYAPQWIP